MRLLISFLLLVQFTAYSQIGVNIGLPERGGTYIDLVKENYRWNNLSTSYPVSPDEVDAQGWPIINAQYIVDFRPVAEWVGVIDDPEVYRLDVSGTWTCSLIGEADVSAFGGTVSGLTYDALSNTSTFDFIVAPGSDGFFIINFDNTRRTPVDPMNSGFTNFKMLRPDYINDDALFHTPFLAVFNMINFSSIRYMVFTNTNGSDPIYPAESEWSNRKLPTDASQMRIDVINKRDGASWEHVIEIANRTKTDPWINVPISASTDYIKGLAELFRDNLDEGLTLYVESSNEVWNTAPGFEQSHYNEDEASDLGISPPENHARRTVEIAQIFESIFGEGSLNSKVNVVLCSHKPMLQWIVVPMLEYIESNYGPPSDYIHAISCQTYFSGGHDLGESVTDILDDCHASITAQIDDVGIDMSGRIQWIEEAASWSLSGGFMSYEGGPDHGGGGVDNIENRILAERTERMCDEMRYNLAEGFIDLGGTLAMQFTLTSSYNRYGCWGLTDDINVPYRNHKFSCLQDLLEIDDSGLAENEEGIQLKVYPNPAFSQVNFSFYSNLDTAVNIILFDALGRPMEIVENRKVGIGENLISFDCSHLSAGIYFYSMTEGDKVLNGSLIIE